MIVAQIAAERPSQPYPGLRPFEASEWSIFFGRERMIDEVIERLARDRLVVIHGASGSGKSSLVRAGVMPKLARQHLRHGAPWVTCNTALGRSAMESRNRIRKAGGARRRSHPH